MERQAVNSPNVLCTLRRDKSYANSHSTSYCLVIVRECGIYYSDIGTDFDRRLIKLSLSTELGMKLQENKEWDEVIQPHWVSSINYSHQRIPHSAKSGLHFTAHNFAIHLFSLCFSINHLKPSGNHTTTASCNIRRLCILPSQNNYVFLIVIAINNNFFFK